MKKIHIVILSVLFPLLSVGQNLRINYGIHKYNKGEYGIAKDYFEDLGNSKKHSSAEIYRWAAKCNTKFGDYYKAEFWLRKLIKEKKPTAEDYALFFQALCDNKEYEEAYNIATTYKNKKLKGSILDAWEDGNNFWQERQSTVAERTSFNSYRSEMMPVIFDGKMYVSYISKANLFPFSAVYYGEELTVIYDFKKESAKISDKKIKGLPENAFVSFSLNGKLALVTKVNRRKQRMSLFFGEVMNGEIGKLQEFKYNSSRYSIQRATISADMKTLVFAADMPGTLGETDLWISRKVNGKWSEPVNLGKQINTAESETNPVFINDSTLCFVSDGHLGFGRSDIYKISWDGKTFGKPQNMGAEINTNFSETAICYSQETGTLYVCADRKGQFDIFECTNIKSSKNENDGHTTINNNNLQVNERTINNNFSSERKTEEERGDGTNTRSIPQKKSTFDKEDIETSEKKIESKKQEIKSNETFYSIQLMALLKQEAKRAFKTKKYNVKHKVMVVKEGSWTKFRTGHFDSFEAALHYAKEHINTKFYIVKMRSNQIIEEFDATSIY